MSIFAAVLLLLQSRTQTQSADRLLRTGEPRHSISRQTETTPRTCNMNGESHGRLASLTKGDRMLQTPMGRHKTRYLLAWGRRGKPE